MYVSVVLLLPGQVFRERKKKIKFQVCIGILYIIHIWVYILYIIVSYAYVPTAAVPVDEHKRSSVNRHRPPKKWW